MELCRHARELWWNEGVNRISSLATVLKCIDGLPRAEDEVLRQSVAPALDAKGAPRTESASIEALERELALRIQALGGAGGTAADGKPILVAVVCHQGVIYELCGSSAQNCDVVECELAASSGGREAALPLESFLRVLRVHPPPGGPRTR